MWYSVTSAAIPSRIQRVLAASLTAPFVSVSKWA